MQVTTEWCTTVRPRLVRPQRPDLCVDWTDANIELEHITSIFTNQVFRSYKLFKLILQH